MKNKRGVALDGRMKGHPDFVQITRFCTNTPDFVQSIPDLVTKINIRSLSAAGDDTDLASSTLLADENSRDIFGMVISYTVKVIIIFKGTLLDITCAVWFSLEF